MKNSKLVHCVLHMNSSCDEEGVGDKATQEPVVEEISESLDTEDYSKNDSVRFSCGSETGNSTGVVAPESDEL